MAASLRLELAQYRELQVFAQLGSDLDKSTQTRLIQGARHIDTLKQKQYAPITLEEQVVTFFVAKNRYLHDIAFYDVARFNQGFLAYLREHASKVHEDIRTTREYSDESDAALRRAADAYKEGFKPSNP